MQQYQFGKMRLSPRTRKEIVAVERKGVGLHGGPFPTWLTFCIVALDFLLSEADHSGKFHHWNEKLR
ncbi:hypothetical protein N8Z91_02895 [Ascidiaceihabitans sp.]|nr:hypothetical protein [Ascidiaceihabitans sp.]